LPIKERTIDKKIQQTMLGNILRSQIQQNTVQVPDTCPRSLAKEWRNTWSEYVKTGLKSPMEHQQEIMENFQTQIRQNQSVKEMMRMDAQADIQKKLKQREELRHEMMRVLEIKRQQKLKAQDEEFKYYL
jgi:hypothetical protein